MALTLSAKETDLVFPYNIVISRNMRILSVGRSMQKLYPQITPGAAFYEVFDIYSPHGVSGWNAIINQSNQSFTLKVKNREKISLRGQFIPRPRSETLVFVGSPSFNKTEEVWEAGLSIRDFAVHDPIMDFMFMHRGHLMALEDTKKLAKKLRNTTGRLREIFAASPEGMASFSADGVLLEFNHPFEETLGLSSDQWFEKMTFSKFIEYLAIQSTNPELVVKWFVSPTESIELEIASTRKFVQIALKIVDGVSMVFMRNITLEKELDHAKSQFISTAAHELRTPMVSIVGFVDLLLNRDYAPEKQRVMLETISRQSKVMSTLLTQLLDLARLESGENESNTPQAVSPVRLVREAVSDFFLQCGQNIRVETDDMLPDALVEPMQARRAIANVLSNAIKYSSENAEILVSITMNGQAKPCIAIKDNGIGMTESELGHLGERFWRADPSGTTSGTGLGIALIKEIMRRNNGSMAISSVYGQGTTVTLTFQPA